MFYSFKCMQQTDKLIFNSTSDNLTTANGTFFPAN